MIILPFQFSSLKICSKMQLKRFGVSRSFCFTPFSMVQTFIVFYFSTRGFHSIRKSDWSNFIFLQGINLFIFLVLFRSIIFIGVCNIFRCALFFDMSGFLVLTSISHKMVCDGHKHRFCSELRVSSSIFCSHLVSYSCFFFCQTASLLGLVGRQLAHWTSEPDSNPRWDALAHPVCKTFNVICVIQCMNLRTITLNIS